MKGNVTTQARLDSGMPKLQSSSRSKSGHEYHCRPHPEFFSDASKTLNNSQSDVQDDADYELVMRDIMIWIIVQGVVHNTGTALAFLQRQ